MHLLNLPNETIYSIALIVWTPPPALHIEDDWRVAKEDATADLKDSAGICPQTRALSRVNRRIRRVLLPFRLRTVFLSTRGKLAIVYNRLMTDGHLGSLVRQLVVRRDCARKSTYAPVTEMLSLFRSLTALHIPDRMQVDLSFFVALSHCQVLKSLHLVCCGGGLIASHVPELKTLRLESLLVEFSAVNFPFVDDKERLPCLPLLDLLSGDTMRSLQHLTLKTSDLNPWSLEPHLELPELSHFLPGGCIFESVQVLKLFFIDSSADCLQKYSRQFPDLRTLLLTSPPPVTIQSLQTFLPSVRRLHVLELSGAKSVVGFIPSMMELSVGNYLDPVPYTGLCNALKMHSPSHLRALSLIVSNIRMTGTDAHALSLLFSGTPVLEKLLLFASEFRKFPRQSWDVNLGHIAAAFALIPRLHTLVWDASIDPENPSEALDMLAAAPDEDNWFKDHEPAVTRIARKLNAVCPDLRSVYWLINSDVGYWLVTSKSDAVQPKSFYCDNTQFWTKIFKKFWNEDL